MPLHLPCATRCTVAQFVVCTGDGRRCKSICLTRLHCYIGRIPLICCQRAACLQAEPHSTLQQQARPSPCPSCTSSAPRVQLFLPLLPPSASEDGLLPASWATLDPPRQLARTRPRRCCPPPLPPPLHLATWRLPRLLWADSGIRCVMFCATDAVRATCLAVVAFHIQRAHSTWRIGFAAHALVQLCSMMMHLFGCTRLRLMCFAHCRR